MHMTDADYMRAAIEEAQRAALSGEVPVGAVLVRDGEIIARAHNTVEADGDATLHAELIAMREGMRALGAKWLTGCTLYVTLEPCAMCAGAAVNARLGRLVFGAFDERLGCCASALDLLDGAFYHTVPAAGGILEMECAALLRDFFAAKR